LAEGVAEAPAPHLDPNARYATTYRPGRAALAAFDAAVARGQIPRAYEDLVGDFAARYSPSVPPPATGALAIAVQTERSAVAPDGGPMNLAVSLASSDATPARAPLSVHIVLDTSGSMLGQAIEDAKRAAEAVVAKLEAGDDFSMVTFSSGAQLLVPDGCIGARRDEVLRRIQTVAADGGTNISAGLDLGYAQARASRVGDETVRLVMLLSDGHANGGDTSSARLSERAALAFGDGIQTSTFGLGPDFDAALMDRIADRGAGGYYYLADSSQIERALSTEIDARLRPVATAVELRVRLRPDVSATHVFGSKALSAEDATAVRSQETAIDRREIRRGIAMDRQDDAAGGMRFFLPAFARADHHTTMITLQLPPGAGERGIASVEVRYKDRVTNKNVTRELPVRVRWAASAADSASTADRSLEPMAQALAAGETILAAAAAVDRGQRAEARALLGERAELLARAAEALSEPRLAEDGTRLARLGDAVGGPSALSDPLPLVVMLRGSGYGYF
jgi:Ca-activated chloride channel family protein